jgi:hypothetical protein
LKQVLNFLFWAFDRNLGFALGGKIDLDKKNCVFEIQLSLVAEALVKGISVSSISMLLSLLLSSAALLMMTALLFAGSMASSASLTDSRGSVFPWP